MDATPPHGLVIVYTGDGKGKTTAALGLALRAVGHGLRVVVVQFVKAWSVGEHEAAKRLAPELAVHRMGRGFVRGEPEEEDRAAARDALALVRRCLVEGRHALVIADEVLTAVGLRLVTREDVESLLADRPAGVHLVLTGWGAWDSLLARADLVTDMRCVKHPFSRGVAAQPGVEF